jgi:hypothetical protein
MSSGRSPAMSARSATRAERLLDRTAENVAMASTSVPPAVPTDEMVTQSARRPSVAAHRPGNLGSMPRVRLTATGRGVGASGEDDAFTELVRTEVARVAPRARPEIGVAGDDAVTVSVELDRNDQGAVGELMERLLQEPRVESTVLDDR